MDNVTHTLTALVLGRALGLGARPASRRVPYATAALVVAANVQDIDWFALAAGARAYLEAHSGFHSLAGAVVLGAGVGLGFWSYARRRQPSRLAGLRNLLLVSLLGALSHSLLDWATPEGATWLWPLRRTWYALDWLPYVDLWLLVILLFGLGVPSLFRLIGEEIGTRPSAGGLRRGAYAALVAAAVLVAGRATLHSEAVGQLESHLYRERMPLRAAAFPTPLNPLRWTGVAETDSTYEAVEQVLRGPRRSFEVTATYYKPSPSPALTAALTTRSAQAFLAWARFPHASVTPQGGGGRLHLVDVRSSVLVPRPRGFGAWVDVNSRLEVEWESVTFERAGEEPPS